MAGQKTQRRQYTSAGYSQERGLYIADPPPGSAQENLRDFNKAGYDPLSVEYKSRRPWRDHEEDLPLERSVSTARSNPPVVPRKARKEYAWLGEWVRVRAKKQRGWAILCVVLFTFLLVIVAAASQNMVEGARVQNEIEQYRAMAQSLTQENESIAMQLELAKDGGRIRNLAQNDLGMLRPERALHQSIRVQAAPQELAKDTPPVQERQMSFLDIMLGLLDVFHIGE